MVEGDLSQTQASTKWVVSAIIFRCHEDSRCSNVGLEYPPSDRPTLILIKELVAAIGDGRLQELLHRLSCLAVYPRSKSADGLRLLNLMATY
jgi:hypothetical protein